MTAIDFKAGSGVAHTLMKEQMKIYIIYTLAYVNLKMIKSIILSILKEVMKLKLLASFEKIVHSM